jgi:hypothetical protein
MGHKPVALPGEDRGHPGDRRGRAEHDALRQLHDLPLRQVGEDAGSQRLLPRVDIATITTAEEQNRPIRKGTIATGNVAGGVAYETGAGLSIAWLLAVGMREVRSFCIKAEACQRIDDFLRPHPDARTRWHFHVGPAEVTLPPHALATAEPTADFCLLDGGHRLTNVFADFVYLNYVLGRGGILAVDDLQLGSCLLLAQLLLEPRMGFSLVSRTPKMALLRKGTGRLIPRCHRSPCGDGSTPNTRPASSGRRINSPGPESLEPCCGGKVSTRRICRCGESDATRAALAGLVAKPRGRKPDFCRRFFNWHNEEHRHWGIGLLMTAAVHSGQTEAAIASRAAVLATAHARHPERFVRGLPQPLTPAAEVWINPPENRPQVRTPEPPRDSTFVLQVSHSH